MQFYYTSGQQPFETDTALTRLADTLAQRGVRMAGVVQINSENCDGGACDMDVKVLPDGPTLRISQSLGPQSRGCRLDPAALEQAVGLVQQTLDGAQVLIINKFGKHEADGRGFRDLIAQAVALDIPVIVGLNEMNKQAFLDFSGGMAQYVAPDLDTLSALPFGQPAMA